MVSENQEPKQEKPAPTIESKDILFIGMDLGTSQSAIATSSGIQINTASVVGWPKDLISFKLHQKSVLFGDECLRNRMSLDLFYPLEKGVIAAAHKGKKGEDEERKAESPVEFIKHMISLANPKSDQKVYLVVGVPSEASVNDKQAIINTAESSVDSVLVVSQPFLVAYGLGMYGFSLIIDIGAGTTDICRMHGTIPGENDQRTIFKAGNYIDDMLYDLLNAKHPNAQLTKLMAKTYKEKYAFIGDVNEQISIELMVDGKQARFDIAKELKEACEGILPDIFSTVRRLITSFDPEFQYELMNNILLAGCGSLIKGLPLSIETGLTDLGKVNVKLVNDPVFAGAKGALKLGQDMPLTEWQQL
ncbi:rod shape-determining protein [candidate division KSB1 bacterium]